MVLRRAQRVVPQRLVSVGEASQMLNIHPNTLRKWSDQGLIPSYRIGLRRDRRFDVEDLLAFLDGSDEEEEDYAPVLAGIGGG